MMDNDKLRVTERILTTMKKIWYLLNLLLALSSTVWAAETSTIKIEHPWAQESPPTVTTGAAYMTLINQGNQADRLLGASGDVAKMIELHTHLMEGGVMKMRPVQAIEVKPNEPIVFKPGGLHIMLIGLKQPLVEGQTFTLTLNFEKAGKIPVAVTVTRMNPEDGQHDGSMHKP
jgi:copper(I)-binding protein